MDELKDLVTIQETVESEFRLLPKHELPEDYTPPDAGTQLLANLQFACADDQLSQKSSECPFQVSSLCKFYFPMCTK